MGVFYLVSLWWSRDGPNPVLYRAFIYANRSGALFFLCTLCRQLVGQIIFLFFVVFFCLPIQALLFFKIKVPLNINKLHPLNPAATFARPVGPIKHKSTSVFQNKGTAKT